MVPQKMNPGLTDVSLHLGESREERKMLKNIFSLYFSNSRKENISLYWTLSKFTLFWKTEVKIH